MLNRKNTLKGLRITVVGAGPGGLNFANQAALQGASVTVIEKAGDPFKNDKEYTDRSFNLTLNNVGQRALNDDRAWRGGIEVVGRAIHNFGATGEIKYSTYEKDNHATLTSIPRAKLRKNLVSIVKENGVEIKFDCIVQEIDPDKGDVETLDKSGDWNRLNSDLVVLADGINSLADEMLESSPGESLNLTEESFKYVSVNLRPIAELSSHHIHFWREKEMDSIAIGLPNKDGSFAVLLISKFITDSKKSDPFSDVESAGRILQSDFPQLLELDPTIVEQVLHKKVGRFHYKSVSKYILGEKCIVIGDAASATPPWAGFGANTAIYSADVLVKFLVGCSDDISKGLAEYQKHKLKLAKLVSKYAIEHGEFLNKKVTESPDERPIGPILEQLVKSVIKEYDGAAEVEFLKI